MGNNFFSAKLFLNFLQKIDNEENIAKIVSKMVNKTEMLQDSMGLNNRWAEPHVGFTSSESATIDSLTGKFITGNILDSDIKEPKGFRVQLRKPITSERMKQLRKAKLP